MLDTVAAGALETRSERRASTIILPLFASTLFTGSFLLFLVEPMVAKMVLPIFGGAPMVWNTCVVFFQIALLAGYGYAYAAATFLDVRRHAILHVAVLAAPLLLLPVFVGPGWAPPASANQAGWLLLLLTTTIGLPFFAMATSASVLQHWFARTGHASAGDPYFLYASSNLGSLIALAAYPIVIEPTLPLRTQSRWWAIAYAVFVALTCACAIVVRLRQNGDADVHASANRVAAPSIAWRRRGMWLLLAFVPSSLMLAVTNYVTTDVAAVPLLWVLPLALYLITFVLAFGGSGDRARAIATKAAPIIVVALVVCMVGGLSSPLSTILPLHLLAFTLLALQCHGTLAADRPAATRLTEFYFWISLGGMLGGLFNVLVAPLLFNSIVEYPLVIVIACVLVPAAARVKTPSSAFWAAAAPVTIGVVTAALLLTARRSTGAPTWFVPALGLPALLAFAQRARRLRFAAALGAMLVAGAWFGDVNGQVLHAERTFFGVYRVMQDSAGRYHALLHGTTLHGMEALDPARRGEPLTYFHRTGPFGQAFVELPHARDAGHVAVIGLGTGTMAAYAMPGQDWTFYEIDPAVERIARDTRYFFFMQGCADRCRVVLGDARLSLMAAADRSYDLIVLDAFSSDAIPMHLVTDEALSLYLSRLAPGGAMAFHISNRHLRLGPILGRLAANHRLAALEETDVEAFDVKSASQWVVMARTPADLGALTRDARWAPPAGVGQAPLWTDDFSNILSVLNLR